MINRSKKLIALLLVFALMFSMASTCVFAEDGMENADVQEIVTETVPSDNVETEPSEDNPSEEQPLPEVPEESNPEASEEAEPEIQEGEAEENTETPAENAPESPEEPAQESEEQTEQTDETEIASAIPFGFAGMGESYVLSEAELEQKASLAENGLPGILESLVSGVDYEDGVLMFLADTEEYALQVAQAYNAEFMELSFGVATIRLTQNTVIEAMTVAADTAVPMPAVDPNYYIKQEPVIESQLMAGTSTASESAPVHQTWQDWYESSSNPDEYLKYPNSWDEGWNEWHEYQWMHEYVDTFGAWGVAMGDGVIVGVIDSGVQANHPELSGRVECINVDYGTAATTDHGTHVAGIIGAAVNNGIGGAGIAPNVKIKSFCITDSTGSTTNNFAMVKAINAAVSNGCWIVNISMGGYIYNATEAMAIKNAIAKNVTIIAAAGNDSSNILSYPASYNGVISVAATDRTGVLSYFSNWGSRVDIAAPGSDIISTVTGSGYEYMDGTSMACPVVTGVAALYMSKMGRVTPATMKKVLKAATTPVANSGVKFGIVNAGKLFAGDKTAPVISVVDEYGDGVAKPSSGVTLKSKIYISFGGSAQDESHIIIYTTDGTAPAVLNGVVTNGKVYEGPFTPEEIGLLSGDTLKITAATISGIGVKSKTAKLSAKVLPSNKVTSVKLIAPKAVIPGGKATLSAVAYPEGASQSFLWYVEPVSTTGSGTVTISSAGLLSVPATFSGSVKVTVVSKKNYSASASATITVKPLAKVVSVSLEKTRTLGISESYQEQWTPYPVFTLSDGTVLSYGDPGYDAVPVSWSTDKKSVVSIKQAGNGFTATAVRKGTAKLTCSVLDGSNKKVTVAVTVARLADSVQIKGQAAIAAGNKATFTASVLPAAANNRNVVWSLQGAPSGVTISTAGTVTVPAWVTSGSFTVVASSADGSAVGYKTVRLQSGKATAVSLDLNYGENEPINWSYNTKGILSKVYLYTATPVEWDGDDCTWTALEAYVSGPNNVPLVWSSSNSKVVKVDENGRITAVSGGTAKITCKANDGSGKTASVSVTVYVPTSHVNVTPNRMPSDDGTYYLGFGKSMSFKASLGSAYGKPNNQKVYWDFWLYDVEWDSSAGEYVWLDWTDYAKANKLVTISSSGKLTVSKKLLNKWNQIAGDLIVDVIAWPADGAPVSGETQVTLTRAATYLAIHTSYYYNTPIKSGWMYRNNEASLYIKSNGYYKTFQVSSSNPSVCGALIEYDSNGRPRVTLISGVKKGKATIKVTANDGSGKTASLKITIK